MLASTGLILSLNMTSPLTLGPAGVTVWFVGLYLGMSGILALGLYGLKSYLRLHSTNVSRLRYAWRQGILISAWITGLLALSSLRQLGPLDAILLGILLIIVEVYVRFRWP